MDKKKKLPLPRIGDEIYVPSRYHIYLEGSGTSDEVAADMAKLRAAPKMYGALRMALDAEMERVIDQMPNSGVRGAPDWYEMGRDALAEADGKTP